MAEPKLKGQDVMDIDCFKESLMNNLNNMIFMNGLNEETYTSTVTESQRGLIIEMTDGTVFELDICKKE